MGYFFSDNLWQCGRGDHPRGWAVDVTKIDNVNRVRSLIAIKIPDGWVPTQVWPGEARGAVH